MPSDERSMLPERFLFRFALPCLKVDPLWTPAGATLDDSHRLVGLAELERETPPWAELWAGWNPQGLVFRVEVHGKKQAVWCRSTRPDDSDGVQFWIDTRDVHNVHRANRFCHRFFFMPSGGGSTHHKAAGAWLPISRAREHPRALSADSLVAVSERRADGYRLDVCIPAESLTGFDSQEHPRLGFACAVTDRELGEYTLGVGSPMPYEEDPSLWLTLELA